MALNKKILKFLFFTFGLYGIWLLLYELVLKSPGHLDQIITENITYWICLLLDITGYEVHYSLANKLGETFIYLGNSTFPLIRVGASCNGLELLVLFIIFIICYEGRLLNKLWFIPLGLLIIHVLNVLRNYILTLMVIHKSPYFEFFHRYVFIFIVYGSIFLLWMWWAGQQQITRTTDEKK
jgi:exosortase family protein XrtF